MKKIKIFGTFGEQINEEYDYVLSFFKNEEELDFGISSTIEEIRSNGGIITETGLDFIILGTMVYFGDKYVSKELHAQDGWTREIVLEVPVSDLSVWNLSKEKLLSLLCFLTGDIWTINFYKRVKSLEQIIGYQELQLFEQKIEIASLFSGGMDSLISTINYLSSGKKVLLISHAADPITKNAQTVILKELRKAYSVESINQINLWSSFSKVERLEREKTTRSRSFLFLSLAVLVSSSFSNIDFIEIPENGLISLNIPLDMLRVGAYTTRTTHPYYIKQWNELLEIQKLDLKVNNSYWNKTKGEMAGECKNKDLLKKIIPLSSSCSSSTKARYGSLSPNTHCGYCVPCLVRRAAMIKGFDLGVDKTVYRYDIQEILEKEKTIGIQLKSFQYAISRIMKNSYVARGMVYGTGELTGSQEYKDELIGVYIRGLDEVNSLISGGNRYGAS